MKARSAEFSYMSDPLLSLVPATVPTSRLQEDSSQKYPRLPCMVVSYFFCSTSILRTSKPPPRKNSRRTCLSRAMSRLVVCRILSSFKVVSV